jgi:hypothetical protein
MSFSITDAFPTFNYNKLLISKEFLNLFEIDRVINKLEGDNIISTSLYFAPHYNESIEDWEKRYLTHLLKKIDEIPSEWHYEVFLSPDCEKYLDKLSHPRVQINVMKNISSNALPGMLWRYIPISYPNKKLAFVGMNTPMLPWRNLLNFLDKNYKLIRWGGFVDLNEQNVFVYKPISGSFICNIYDENIVYAMSAWMQSEKNRVDKSRLKNNTELHFSKVMYEGRLYDLFGTQLENCYGQDERFLSCYIYPRFKNQSLCIVTGNHERSANNTAFKADIGSILNGSVIYDPCKTSIIDNISTDNVTNVKKNICMVGSIGTSGYAIATQNFIFNYIQNNYNVTFIPRCVDNSKYTHSDIITKTVNDCKYKLYDRYDYFIVHFVVDQFKNLYNEYFNIRNLVKNKDCKVILQTVWETTKIPQYWVDVLNDPVIDEIWVPSIFNKKIFEESGVKTKIKIKRYISYNMIDQVEKSDIVAPNHIQYGNKDITKTYNFYSISSWSDRKNYVNTIREFCKTFTKHDNVSYLIKTTVENYEDHFKDKIKHEFESILSDFPDHPDFYLFLDNYETYEINNIHTLGDCYYLLTRGEGLGYSAYDAYINNKPVIITKFGGQLEYFPENYPFFVDYTLVPVEGMKNTKSYSSHDHSWAEPNYNQARNLLKNVYEKYNSNRHQ